MTVLKWQRVIRFLLIHLIYIVSAQTDSTAPCPYNATGVVPLVEQLFEWNYLGCYQDNPDRILNNTMYFGPENNTVAGCANFCRGYAFLGVEFGAQCFCGASLGAAVNTKPTSDAHCNYTCCADRTVSCGGAGHINIYETLEPSPIGTPSPSTSNTPPPTSPSPSPSPSLNSGAKAAIGLAASIVALFIIFALGCLIHWKRRPRSQQDNQTHGSIELVPSPTVKQRSIWEMNGQQQGQLDGNARSEVDGRAKTELEARRGF